MVPIEVVIIGALVVFMLAVAILPALVRSMQGGGGGEKREKKTKRGVTKSQMCLQPGCVRCAFSTDPASLQAFRRHLWESFRALATAPGGDHLGPAQDDEQSRPTIHSRIGPAVKRLVTTSTPPGGHGDAPLLPIEGLSAIDDARRLAWVDQLLPAIPRMAAEARRAWSERVAPPAPTADKAGATTTAAATTAVTGEGGGRWRRQEDAAGDGCVGWKWDLWNQGTLVETHAQRAPETVQLLEQHAADSLMKDCAFGFAYFHVLLKEPEKSPSATPPASDDLVPDHDLEGDQGLRQRASAKKAKSEERSEKAKNESDAIATPPNGTENARRRSVGPTNARLRCRFVLSTPGTSGAFYAEAKWEAGACLASNDPRHELRVERSSASAEATRDGEDDDKLIALTLVVDVWHPDLAPIERQALSKLFPASSDASSSALVD